MTLTAAQGANLTVATQNLLVRFLKDDAGATAIEFAILAPLLITLYLGCVEITDGIAADRKVTLTAGALANLTSQSQTITVAGMSRLNASSKAAGTRSSTRSRPSVARHRTTQGSTRKPCWASG